MDRIIAERRAPFGASPEVGERGRATQQRILGAALEVFGEVGYEAARIDAITERAGCSRPTFYQYFASKEALFNRLGGLLGTSLLGLVEEVPSIDAGAGPSEDLRDWVGELVDLHECWAPAFVAFRPALRGDPGLRAGAAELTVRYGKALARSVSPGGGRVAGADDAADVEMDAALVVTMLTGALSLQSAVGAGPDPDHAAVVDQLAAVLHAGLVGPAGRAHGSSAAAAWSAEGGARSAREGEDGEVEAALASAALTVFPRLGVEGTRVDDLVEEAGVAHGTFYRYFTDKAELFERVAGRAAQAMFELLAELPDARTAGRIDDWTEHWFTTYLDHGAILSVWAEAPPSEAGFSDDAAAAAIDLLAPALDLDGRVTGAVSVLAVLSLVEWAPYLAHQLDGFERDRVVPATARVLDRLLSPPAGERGA